MMSYFLKLMHFQQEGAVGVPEIEDGLEISNEAIIPIINVVSLKLGGNVKWTSPL